MLKQNLEQTHGIYGICEGIWTNRILEELKLSQKTPIQIYCNMHILPSDDKINN